MTGETVLEVEGVVAGYVPEVDILKDCSLEVRHDEIVGIVGPNGAGKSTLIKAIFGQVDVRSGQVRFKGDDITDRPAHTLVARGLGVVPQRDNVFASLTVTENLEMGLYLEPDRFPERVERVMTLFPLLGERRKQRAGSLSGGERQMVAMGRALMMDPEVLMLDEPSAGLSPALQSLVFEQIDVIRSSGVAVLMVEQNARRCLEIADRGYVLDQGRNAHTGTGTELLDDPKVVELYLGSLATRRR